MHSVLINNYNACVKDEDVCYFLGDIGICKGSIIKDIISKLNGTKVLILGNHDANTFSMYDRGFDVVLNAGVFYMGDKRISMSHCPLPGIFREDITDMKGATSGENWHGELKNDMFMSRDTSVDFHLSGHIHSGPHTDKKETRTVSLSEIESWINMVSKNKK